MAKDKYARTGDRNSGTGKFNILDGAKYKYETIKYKENAEHALDLVPYKIATAHHPEVVAGRAEVGDEDYILDMWVHYKVGPGQSTIICPRCYGKTCIICDHKEDIDATYGRNSAEAKEGYRKYGTARRVAYFAIDPDSKEKKVQLFETSFNKFQKELWAEAISVGKKQGLACIPFAEWPGGCTVEFRVEMNKNGGAAQPFPEYKSFKFTPRKGKEYPDIDLADIPGLDELMIIHSPAAIEKMFNGEDEEDVEDVDIAQEEENIPSTESKEEEAAPRRRERPVEEEPGEKVGTKCPIKGGKFGVSVGDLPECEDCKLWSACSAEYRSKSRKGA
jgi:hypothetical protein